MALSTLLASLLGRDGGQSRPRSSASSSSSSAKSGAGVGGSSSSNNTSEDVVSSAQASFEQIFPGASLSPDELFAQSDALGREGITVLRNAAGTTAKIRLPNGAVIDVIGGAESGRNIRQFNDTGVFIDLAGKQVPGPSGATTADSAGSGGTAASRDNAGGITVQRTPGGPSVFRPGATRTGGRAVPRPDPFGSPTGPDNTSAAAAALRQRRRAEAGGRQGTVFGGFGGGAPTTLPKTLLGS